LSDRRLVGALKRASDAGADIAGVYDPNGMAAVVHASHGDDRRFWFLRDPRFVPAPSHPFVPGAQQDFLHHKLVILNRNTVVTGSYNFSSQARHNAENVVVAESSAAAGRYLGYWHRLAAAYGLQAAA
jgi:phosphatidylserine/phosphatidylglycerophosphate/cardiolipin synthase-like enzyme